jgi:hypothetical protein
MGAIRRAAHQILDDRLVPADPLAVAILGADEQAKLQQDAANDGSQFGLAERTAVRRPGGRASTRRPPARLKVSVLMVPAPERVVLRLAGARHGQVMSST